MSLPERSRTDPTPLRASAPAAVPYRLVVPQGWTRLPVEPTAMRAAARALLQRRFAHHPRDATATLRREVEQQLVALTQGAGREYLRMLLTLDLPVERVPVTATCLVSLLPYPVAGEQGLAELAASQSAGALESVVEDLGGQRGVVVVRDVTGPGLALDDQGVRLAHRYAAWLRSGEDAADDDAPGRPDEVPDEALHAATTTRSVDVFLPVPDSPRVLLLSFSTPVTPLFAPLTRLFLTIASTVQWQRDGRSWD